MRLVQAIVLFSSFVPPPPCFQLLYLSTWPPVVPCFPLFLLQLCIMPFLRACST
ncbi:MAG: hypothetical protein BYD32DRAFT_429339 [Podila humilis]|nr:MAG: hypothetical protein BYD32DRAFT_429339 [Podila humilis]